MYRLNLQHPVLCEVLDTGGPLLNLGSFDLRPSLKLFSQEASKIGQDLVRGEISADILITFARTTIRVAIPQLK